MINEDLCDLAAAHIAKIAVYKRSAKQGVSACFSHVEVLRRELITIVLSTCSLFVVAQHKFVDW